MPEGSALSPAQVRAVADIRAELTRLVRHDDESVVNERWIRQRYDGFYAATYLPARSAAVVTAWHEAGHAVAALAIGGRFRSASIYHATDSSGRVHGITVPRDQAFVVGPAGPLAEPLPRSAPDRRAWRAGGRPAGGAARRFRRDLQATYGSDEVGAWRHCERLLT